MNRRKIKEEEIRKKMINTTNQEIRNKFINSQTVLDNQKGQKKYSEVFHNYMEPFINEVLNDEKLLKTTMNWGLFIWNKAVADKFPDLTRSKDLIMIFPLFRASFQDKTLIAKFLNRKKKLFNNEDFFIVEQTSLLDEKGRLCISVAALPIDDDL